MKSVRVLTVLAWALVCGPAMSGEPDGSSPQDFAYRMQVLAGADAAAYRLTLPLVVYQKIAHPDLSDIRVFNASGEQVPFTIERAPPTSIADAATALPLFPLTDNSGTTPDALRVTIESGKNAISVRAPGEPAEAGRVSTYLVDGRALQGAVAALRLQWPEDAADFAGRMKVEASDNLADWHIVSLAAPVANLHASSERLVEQRLELSPEKARYWRLSWVGSTAPFVLTGVQAEPASQSVEARHANLSVSELAAEHTPGEFEYALHARLPLDRLNLELPDANTVVEVELLSRAHANDPWRSVRNAGFYRLKSGHGELRNGPVSIPLNTDPYWLVRTDPKKGGLGKVAPMLVVEWVPHELVFVARGAPPFYVAFGSVAAQTTAALSLAFLPRNVSIAPASLSDPEPLGGDDRLRPPTPPYAWKAALLWVVLIGATGLLAWMAFRLSKDLRTG